MSRKADLVSSIIRGVMRAYYETQYTDTSIINEDACYCGNAYILENPYRDGSEDCTGCHLMGLAEQYETLYVGDSGKNLM